MILKRGTVIDSVDPLKSGHISVLLDGGNPVSVVYVSPFYSVPQGNEQKSYAGMFMPPKPGTSVLVGQDPDEESTTWFYMGSVVGDTGDLTPKENSTKLTGTLDHEYTSQHPGSRENSYSHQPHPQVIGIEGANGANFSISEKDNKEMGSEKYTRLQSESGMGVVASDTAKQIILHNGQQDGITITRDGHPGNTLGWRCIESKAKGNNYITSFEGAAEVKSMGRDTRIIARGIPNQFKDATDGEVFIESYLNDIIINVPSDAGRVFIDARGADGLVQVRAGSGGVSVHSSGPIDLNSDQDISINSGGDINLQGNNINLNPGQFSGKTDPTLNNRDV